MFFDKTDLTGLAVRDYFAGKTLSSALVEQILNGAIETKDKFKSKTDSVNLELLRTNEELLTEVSFNYDVNSKKTVVTLTSNSIVAKADLDGFMARDTMPNANTGIGTWKTYPKSILRL